MLNCILLCRFLCIHLVLTASSSSRGTVSHSTGKNIRFRRRGLGFKSQLCDLPACVTLGESPYPHHPCFPLLQNGVDAPFKNTRLLWGLNKVIINIALAKLKKEVHYHSLYCPQSLPLGKLCKFLLNVICFKNKGKTWYYWFWNHWRRVLLVYD